MIFITLGSQKFQCDRLLQAIDSLIECQVITEPVFAQTGASTYVPQHYSYRSFLDRDAFRETMTRCDVVITHGGTGAIVGALKAGKKVIAIPRRKEFGEHVDDHQEQIIQQFAQSNLICPCMDPAELADAYIQLRQAEYAPYKSNTQRYLQEIRSFIDKM